MQKIKFFFLIVCVFQLAYLFHYRSDFKYEIIKNPFHKDSGIRYAVSVEILESRDLIKKNKVTNFNLSESLKKDTYFYQRSIEFNYPVRLNENSEFIFFLINENLPNNCSQIQEGSYLKLAEC